jgi:hypothetical protein
MKLGPLTAKASLRQKATEGGVEVIDKDRGSPDNKGVDFKASQYVLHLQQHFDKLILTPVSPVVRTNPVTGYVKSALCICSALTDPRWKSLMAAGHQVDQGRFDNVTRREDEILKAYCWFHLP